jgi:hypothetical protein
LEETEFSRKNLRLSWLVFKTFLELLVKIAILIYSFNGLLLDIHTSIQLLLRTMDASEGRKAMMRESRSAGTIRFSARTVGR